MNIVMHCSGIPFNGETVNNQSLGGSESAAYYMAREFSTLGHSVTLFTNTVDEGEWDGVRYVNLGQISEQQPMGNRFDYYASNTPHDILIIQRHPLAFAKRYASKVNILWLHDLALYRTKTLMDSQMWNIDAVFTVSEYHKNQVCEVYGFNPEIVIPVKNGVDLSLFKTESAEIPPRQSKFEDAVAQIPSNKKMLTYSSRPERGLNHLVRPGGIMDQLLTQAPDAHLVVCGYDNTTEQMRPLYEALWARCEELSNVTYLGSITKRELAQLMKRAFLHVYPTAFEEVSCITAMECAAAGLPFISSKCAALPETCKSTGSVLIPLKDGQADESEFIQVVSDFCTEVFPWENMDLLIGDQEKAGSRFSWANSAEHIDLVMHSLISDENFSIESRKAHMLRNSDIIPLEQTPDVGMSLIELAIDRELDQCYDFFHHDNFKQHYANYYAYEKGRGVDYGPENLDGNLRFESVSNIVGSLPAGSLILDYGCAHGHYTINLAKRFPKLVFSGVDIEESNISKAEAWAEQEGLINVHFTCGEVSSGLGLSSDKADCLLACEVLEHVGDINLKVAQLRGLLKDGGLFVATTPFGPWEALGYQEHWPWRAHLYHFERADLEHLFNRMPDFTIQVVPSSILPTGESLGSYLFTFAEDQAAVVRDYAKVAYNTPARETVSLCMIARDAEDTISKCLKSALPFVDEVIIGVDQDTCDMTSFLIDELTVEYPSVYIQEVSIESPIVVGFDTARNGVVDRASGDWILWLDSDEELINGGEMVKYLRRNMFSGYAIAQNHFSADPAGVIKTDYPCKLFRNHQKIQFKGKVHEHPEEEDFEGIHYVSMLPGVSIAHYGYGDETTRRKRFQRNLSLLAQDRAERPERVLGKFLWLRDLSQMNQYEYEMTGSISDDMVNRAREGIDLWRELLADNLRMAVDSVDFYSSCVRLTGKGFETSFSLDTNLVQGKVNAHGVVPTTVRFANELDATGLINSIIHERVKDYGSKYF